VENVAPFLEVGVFVSIPNSYDREGRKVLNLFPSHLKIIPSDKRGKIDSVEYRIGVSGFYLQRDMEER